MYSSILRHSALGLMFLLASLIVRKARGQDFAAKFYRGINLNGPAVVIDGQQWEAGDAVDIEFQAAGVENQTVPLQPSTDTSRAMMIRSSRWGRNFSLAMRNIPPGDYQVFTYVWEDNNSEQYSIELNGETVVAQYASGAAGTWKRLGPWKILVEKGTLLISAKGGAANFSGIEVWAGLGEVPQPFVAHFADSPSEEQLHFFESRIRPLLIDHCYECHNKDASEIGGRLLLDSRAGIIKGGDTEPLILPGDPDNSLLMRAVGYADAALKMPPAGKLSTEQIADLAMWIRMRAPDPRLENTVAELKARTEIDWDEARDFWSLTPLSNPLPPDVNNPAWALTPIDRFVAQQLDAVGLTPAADCDKWTLIRRATFDLLGLPPSPEEVEAFLADDSPEAFEKVVDRLLHSPLYGQRWGRHWLDVVRYADTAGDNSDFPIPQIYLYRNWVIDAFNSDLPYDQFVREQLAGDLLDSSTESAKRSRIIATGYIAISRRFGSRVDDYPWHLTIEDTLDNLGRTFLATSINCARCHDHKFDPITTEDYYALYGFFESTRYPWPGIELEQRQRDLVALADPKEVSRVEQERRDRQKELNAILKKAKKDRDAATEDTLNLLEEGVKKAEEAVRKHAGEPLPYETLYAVADAPTIKDAAVQLKGDPAKTGEVVPRRFLQMLHGKSLAATDLTSGRLQLANWIVDPDNPLTARVMVNRLWLYHFGKALVTTPNDFGRHGQVPTHPELLDWLSTYFIDSGWSIKAMHRAIMLSRTYRMSSDWSDRAIEIDPDNHRLSAFPRHRLDAEAIRDSLLLLGGNLDLVPGESHPFPPPSQWKFTQHNPFKANYQTNRRSVYLMTQRIQRQPFFSIFDGADPSASTPQRLTSTTPLQALYLLNDHLVHQQAAAIAERLLANSDDEIKRITRAWLLLFGRPPDADETASAVEFLAEAGVVLEMQNNASSAADGPTAQDTRPRIELWQSLVRSLLQTNEFVYID